MKRHPWLRWLKSLFSPRSRTYRRMPEHRPNLERLESRLAPATYIWTGAGGNTSMNNPLNWQGNAAPTGSAGALEDLVFGPAAGAGVRNVQNNLNNAVFNSITF